MSEGSMAGLWRLRQCRQATALALAPPLASLPPAEQQCLFPQLTASTSSSWSQQEPARQQLVKSTQARFAN